MTTTTLTLFDLTDIAPTVDCTRCGRRPATTRVYAVQNLLGVHPAWMTGSWFRDATRRAHSGPCCDLCASYLAHSWWSPSATCPRGACHLWVHTLASPRPAIDCSRHHVERTVVWRDQLEVAA